MTLDELTPAIARQLVEQHGSIRAAARETGITYSVMHKRCKDAGHTPNVVIPDLPSDERPIDDVIAGCVDEFQRRHERWKASHFQPVIINTNEPIGIMWFGDPHVDDNGCNWPQLLKDIEIAKQPGVYGVNIGDTTNNWVGRLVKKYAEQETTRTNAWRLCEWFLNDAGIPWLFWLLGNHDVWNDGAEIMKRMNIQKVLMHDWMASLEMQFPNGWKPRVLAAHGFKGKSQFHEVHGGLKKAMRNIAVLYVEGHEHAWGMYTTESEDTHDKYWVAKVRGYKHMDEYALRNGFGCQHTGAAMMSVFDPEKQQIECFSDAERGADYLRYLRLKAGGRLRLQPGD